MNFRILFAIVRKDLQSLYPLALLAALLFAADVFILRWELVPMWAQFRQLPLFVVGALATLAVFQLDAPVSLVDDWLCRPVPRRELVAAKLAFLLLVIYLPGAAATLVADLCLGASLAEAVQDAAAAREKLKSALAQPSGKGVLINFSRGGKKSWVVIERASR